MGNMVILLPVVSGGLFLLADVLVHHFLTGVVPVYAGVPELFVGGTQFFHLVGQQLVLCRGQLFGGAGQFLQSIEHVVYGWAGYVRYFGSPFPDLIPNLFVFGKSTLSSHH
jgi:hypothetical protein